MPKVARGWFVGLVGDGVVGDAAGVNAGDDPASPPSLGAAHLEPALDVRTSLGVVGCLLGAVTDQRGGERQQVSPGLWTVWAVPRSPPARLCIPLRVVRAGPLRYEAGAWDMSDSPPERVLVERARQELLVSLESLEELQGMLGRLPDIGLEAAGTGAETDR